MHEMNENNVFSFFEQEFKKIQGNTGKIYGTANYFLFFFNFKICQNVLNYFNL